jgi:2-methylfumaryl-CoA isomerase
VTHDFLNRVRVVESSAFIAAPLAGLTLSQFGADVIRVDMMGGGIDCGRMPLMPSGRSLSFRDAQRLLALLFARASGPAFK